MIWVVLLNKPPVNENKRSEFPTKDQSNKNVYKFENAPQQNNSFAFGKIRSFIY